MKRYQVTVEIISQYEVTVFAEDFTDAAKKSEKIPLDEVLESTRVDHERRVVSVNHNASMRMYK